MNNKEEKDSILVTLRAVNIVRRCIFSLYSLVFNPNTQKNIMRKKAEDLRAHHKTLPIAFRYSIIDKGQGYEEEYSLEEHKNVFNFNDLKWTLIYVTREEDMYPLQCIARAYVDFDNGFYVSIINGLYSIGGIDQYEIAILDENGICYDTPLTDDVVGCLDKQGVEKWLRSVSLLDYDDRVEPEFNNLQWHDKLHE